MFASRVNLFLPATTLTLSLIFSLCLFNGHEQATFSFLSQYCFKLEYTFILYTFYLYPYMANKIALSPKPGALIAVRLTSKLCLALTLTLTIALAWQVLVCSLDTAAMSTWNSPFHALLASIQLTEHSLCATSSFLGHGDSILAYAALVTGSFWNYVETGLQSLWLWDPIEYVPLLIWFNFLQKTHNWALLYLTPGLTWALGLSQLNQAGLLQSAHHIRTGQADVSLGRLAILTWFQPTLKVGSLTVLANGWLLLGVCWLLSYVLRTQVRVSFSLRPAAKQASFSLLVGVSIVGACDLLGCLLAFSYTSFLFFAQKAKNFNNNPLKALLLLHLGVAFFCSCGLASSWLQLQERCIASYQGSSSYSLNPVNAKALVWFLPSGWLLVRVRGKYAYPAPLLYRKLR